MRRSTHNAAGEDGLPKTHSVWSKLASPFSSRKRNVAEYYVRAKEPHRQYSPGDKVEGTVVLTVTKPLRISHMVVCLHGFVKVYNSARSPGQAVSRDGGLLGGGIGKRGSTYFGDGFASLFENEIALCGEGRLEPGSFEFQFSLEFPAKGIPSSISFERGTISYMITSTLTRPTTIGPTMRCERQVQLVETVDIAPLRQPKPRMVSVETLSRKSINKISPRSANAASVREISRSLSKVGARKSALSSMLPNGQPLRRPPVSPARSELSSISIQSSPASSRHTGRLGPPSKSSNESDGRSSSGCHADEMVTATIQLLRGGCLPGDKLPLEISISHNRPVKRLQGIIITMYREGHMDTHPAIPLGPSQPGKKQEYEDYYPKSRTGLGGLSLSSAGSSSGFRKNLSQKIVPLIVDPQSLQATVKTSIQAPEDLFPTISTVPGAMMTFKYFIEVVIDLGGKSTGSDRILPRLHMTGSASKFEPGDLMGNKFDASEGLTFPFAIPLTFLNTECVRREKGVVACVFEVVVGTRDSRRKRLRRSEYHLAPADHPPDVQRSAEDRSGSGDMSAVIPARPPCQETWTPSRESMCGAPDNVGRLRLMNDANRSESYIVPPPEMAEELDEKARIRRAEQQILPSAPSQDAISPITNDVREQPSAPLVFDRQDLFLVQDQNRSDAIIYDTMPLSATERYVPSIHDPSSTINSMMNYIGPTADGQADKLELEHHRLMMAVSSPDDVHGSPPAGLNFQSHRFTSPTAHPSAPWLDHDHQHESYDFSESQTSGLDAAQLGRENLPSYER